MICWGKCEKGEFLGKGQGDEYRREEMGKITIIISGKKHIEGIILLKIFPKPYNRHNAEYKYTYEVFINVSHLS